MEAIEAIKEQLLTPQNYGRSGYFNPTDYRFWATSKSILMVRRIKSNRSKRRSSISSGLLKRLQGK